MSEFHGISGAVTTANGTFFNCSRFNVDTEQDNVEVRKFVTTAGVKWVSNLRGHGRWSGSFEGYMDDATGIDIATTGELDAIATATFTDGTGNTRVGTLLITRISEVNDSTDAGKYVVDFVGSGTLT